jgi:hypothetical protein
MPRHGKTLLVVAITLTVVAAGGAAVWLASSVRTGESRAERAALAEPRKPSPNLPPEPKPQVFEPPTDPAAPPKATEPPKSEVFDRSYAEARRFNSNRPEAQATAADRGFERVMRAYWDHIEPMYQNPGFISVNMASWHLLEPETRREIVAAANDPSLRAKLSPHARDVIIKGAGKNWLDH